ncbi:MAG: hypothetical protein ACI909_004101 [Planctomycetota bacterium]|jgi:hypothetical protein
MIIAQENKPWYREPYVWLLISFPLAAVLGGIVTIILAIQSDDGLVLDDYYKQGMEINRTIEKDKIALFHEIHASLQYADDNDQIRLIISAANNFSYPEKLNIKYLNASRKGLDQEQILGRDGQNIYLGANPKLARGKWHILIEGEDWRILNIIHVP